MLVGVAAGSLSEVWGEVQRAAGAMERLTELLNIQSNIRIPKVPIAFPRPVRGAVRFEQVNFSYPSRTDEFAVRQFSLDIEPENMWHSSVLQVLEKVLFSNCYSDFMTRSQVELPLMASIFILQIRRPLDL